MIPAKLIRIVVLALPLERADQGMLASLISCLLEVDERGDESARDIKLLWLCERSLQQTLKAAAPVTRPKHVYAFNSFATGFRR